MGILTTEALKAVQEEKERVQKERGSKERYLWVLLCRLFARNKKTPTVNDQDKWLESYLPKPEFRWWGVNFPGSFGAEDVPTCTIDGVRFTAEGKDRLWIVEQVGNEIRAVEFVSSLLTVGEYIVNNFPEVMP